MPVRDGIHLKRYNFLKGIPSSLYAHEEEEQVSKEFARGITRGEDERFLHIGCFAESLYRNTILFYKHTRCLARSQGEK
jgi:hypothetical protein